MLLGDISRGNINAAREAAVITCPFIHPGCPDHWAIELVSLRLGEYLFMQSSIFSKGLRRQKHPIKYNSMVIKHLPRDSGSQTARKPELLPRCPLTRDIVLARGLLLRLFRVLCGIKIAPIGVSTVLGKNREVLCL